MGTQLPRSTPVDEHVDPAALLAFVEAVDGDPEIELHSLMVVRHGRVVAEGWWAPHTPERTRLLYSISKSFTSTALAFALEEGLVGLDDPVVAHFPELADDVTDPRSRAMLVRHLASMASGHDRDLFAEALAADPGEPVRGFLMVPPDDEPGSRFAYNQLCTYTLASIIQRAAGAPLTDYLRPRLLDPLGIGEVGWLTWPPGREQGFSGLFARTEDVAKLGLLYLQRGRWGDTQLLPAAYVDLATSRLVDTAAQQDKVDWQQGYGLQFWRARHGYRGDGAFGQFCVVLPEHDVVVATTGGTEAMQEVLDHLWTQLLPGFLSERPDDGAQEDLDRRLRGLALPAYAGGSGPTGRFDLAPGTTFTSLEVRPGPEITLGERANAITFPVGTDGWLTSEPRDARGDVVPVAASGGWQDDDTLRVGVVLLETAHRLDLTCSRSTGAGRVAWRTEPLGGAALATLHRPGRRRD